MRLLQKGRIDDAIDHYQKAMMARPDHFLARYGLCHALLEKGELDSAIQVCRSALVLRPLDADCHTTLAIALEEKGNPAEAIQHYQKALELCTELHSHANQSSVAAGDIPGRVTAKWSEGG